MKVLLTSGGTRTAIDAVRHVGNMSSGTFGNHLCRAFLYAKGSKCPHELRLSLGQALLEPQSDDWTSCVQHGLGDLVAEQFGFLASCRDRYRPTWYDNFDGYAAELFRLIGSVRPDIVVLAAAVSDYAPVKAEGKISSELDEMTIRLEKTPKLIRKVKDVLPECFLVGFKLLVDSTQEQLEAAMADQMAKARTDMVVGNDLRDIKAARHVLTILGIDQLFYRFDPMPGAELARELAEEITTQARTLRGEHRRIGA
jgi:phosphopantothenoylcysteine synthetase/decarboxylase